MSGEVRMILLVFGLLLAAFLAVAGLIVRRSAPKGRAFSGGGLLLSGLALAAGMLVWFLR